MFVVLYCYSFSIFQNLFLTNVKGFLFICLCCFYYSGDFYERVLNTTFAVQSCTGTMIRPSWVPTSFTLFKPLLLEVSTNLANSYNEETWVTLYTSLIKPKDWSRPNFVCPAIREEYVIERWSFSKILYVSYQRKKLFSFWPVQLSA